ncbi:pyridoxal 5'-phosphate synthase glutaminase subunit PdxT [Anaerostipes sp.]|uniref:pyridoxal 5'-phosphate synthase glutaminase subunit PdxT n=1 Tax=Anaerostipes sp. TaxID=1872530 RepID=UPI0025BB9D69|nr:pyridoxal 5'-phosphate synthase glutaminase subunit PdxT [Anaerostipes sp.]MBS7009728.1 pyridoxal 5'-phosphate synthase glutaminase subunit PdxT [Anaerostipes sp.]
MRIGVLALQGAFAEHREKIEALGAESFEIRSGKDLHRQMDGMILPGGESTVMGKLLSELDMTEPLKDMIAGGLPAFGTCAGLILMAQKVMGQETPHLGTMNITARRNAYGRQLGSFCTKENFGEKKEVPMTFIRAPYIQTAGEGVSILSSVNGHIVAARQGNQLVTAFHPELDDDNTVHQYFLNMAERT